MRIEREDLRFPSKPKMMHDQERPLHPAEAKALGEFRGQPRSSLEKRWIEFMQEVISRGAFLRPHGARSKVWLRQQDIMMSRLRGESIESISQRFGKPVDWVTAQLRYGTERVWNNIPEELRQKHPKGSLFPKRSEMITLRRKENDMTLASQLQREDLNREELQELMAKVGYNFYRRHKELFIKVLKLARDVGFKRPSVADLDLIVDVLKRDGGVVITTCHRSGTKIPIFLEQDYFDARYTVESSEKLKNLIE